MGVLGRSVTFFYTGGPSLFFFFSFFLFFFFFFFSFLFLFIPISIFLFLFFSSSPPYLYSLKEKLDLSACESDIA